MTCLSPSFSRNLHPPFPSPPPSFPPSYSNQPSMATTTTTSSPRGFLGMGWGNSSLSRTLGRGGQRVVVPQALPVPNSSSNAAGGSEVTQDGKRQTLFGPHIGGDEEDDEFGLGEGGEGGVKESVSVETVKGWIERSKSGEVSSRSLFFAFDSLPCLGRRVVAVLRIRVSVLDLP